MQYYESKMSTESIKPTGLDDRSILINITRNLCWRIDEFKLVIDTMPRGDPLRIAMLIAITLGLRAAEISDLRFSCFNSDLTSITYKVYKPTSTQNKRSNTTVYKANTKPIISKLFREELAIYLDSIKGEYINDKIFGTKNGQSITRRWQRYRAKLIKEPKFSFLNDQIFETIAGNNVNCRRCNFHALRRTNFTFYWHNSLYGNRDVVKALRWTAHSDFRTLSNHYLYTADDIGLNEGLLRCGITFDEFLSLNPKEQKYINDYLPKREIVIPVIKKGQSQLLSFI